ncbi:hypothetical protein [Streptomyces sp.]|uniref:hypothetical protein n=1 Tax=Streptomyces sp. TaxID=1931 RepID=UPI002F92DEA3
MNDRLDVGVDVNIRECHLIGGGFQLTIRNDAPATWTQADPEIHIATRFLNSSVAKATILAKYDVVGTCPHNSWLYHARRRDIDWAAQP